MKERKFCVKMEILYDFSTPAHLNYILNLSGIENLFEKIPKNKVLKKRWSERIAVAGSESSVLIEKKRVQ